MAEEYELTEEQYGKIRNTLLAEKANGSVDTLYSHWMLGEAMKVDRPPRRSVIRNVLGWVD